MNIHFSTTPKGAIVYDGTTRIGSIVNDPKTGVKTLTVGNQTADVTHIFHDHAKLAAKVRDMRTT